MTVSELNKAIMIVVVCLVLGMVGGIMFILFD
jgi:uncharacterized protein YneF (UPF0154 family)